MKGCFIQFGFCVVFPSLPLVGICLGVYPSCATVSRAPMDMRLRASWCLCFSWVVDLVAPTDLEPWFLVGRFRARDSACGYSAGDFCSSLSGQSHIPRGGLFTHHLAERLTALGIEVSSTSQVCRSLVPLPWPPRESQASPGMSLGLLFFSWDRKGTAHPAASPHTEPSHSALPVRALLLALPDVEGKGGSGIFGIRNLASDLKPGTPSWNLTHRR